MKTGLTELEALSFSEIMEIAQEVAEVYGSSS